MVLAWAILGAAVGGLLFAFFVGAGWFAPPLWLAPALMLAGVACAAFAPPRFGAPRMDPPVVGV